MDVNLIVQGINDLIRELALLVEDVRATYVDSTPDHYKRASKLLHVFAPLLTAVIFYHYLKYLLIFNAQEYESFVRKRCGHLRKLSKQLRHLAKRYGNYYFCYMPMNHGTNLPQTYSLFMAIKEVLINSDRPATRVIRSNLLLDLIHGDRRDVDANHSYMNLRDGDLFDSEPDDLDPLFEYNLDIMKCSRELIIHGIKDFETMTTVFRVMETVMEE